MVQNHLVKNLIQIIYLKKIKNKKKNIKNILLDQNIIAGLGNIYVNEILFYSKINPKKKGSKFLKMK